MRTIEIQYYAALREERGLSREVLETAAATPRELYDWLRAEHRFSLPPERLTVAVNDEFADWNRALGSNDSVVFIPPVAGG